MSFFERQAQARRASRKLLWMLVPALAGLLVAANIASIALWYVLYLFGFGNTHDFWPPGWFFPAVTVGTAWYVAMGTWDAINLVSQGGAAVARYLGARELDPRSTDVNELRLRNVVEEMAIASGLPAPAVFVMDGEDSINAFVAGSAARDAAVVVTGGALRELRRDELQGVVAHEFSHILNGDIGLNMRLFGLLGGILRIWLVGQAVLERERRSREAQGPNGKGNGLYVIAGGLLSLVGGLGHWAAGRVSAAVSRQREFLADACAVQYTRDPDGIAGALVKLGAGGRIHHPYAEHVAFMFFGEGLPMERMTSFATHPALTARLAAIYGKPVTLAEVASRVRNRPQAEKAPAANVAYAAALLARLPASVQGPLHDGEGAIVAMFALVLAPEGAGRDAQLGALGARAAAVAAAHAAIAPLGAAARLPLIELAAPALRKLDAEARRDFLARFDALIAADRRVTLQEFVLEAILRGLLEDAPVGGAALRSLGGEARTLLSLAAHASGAGAEAAFARCREALGTGMALAAVGELNLPGVRAALQRLRELHPLQKPRLLKAVSAAALADGSVSVAETELLRAISAALDCPMPPLAAVPT
jgi:Zn-dependent protease with chaperone function